MADLNPDGTALPFEGSYVNYKRTGLTADMFQTIQAGETITADVNAAVSYKLEGVNTAEVTAVQGFRYVTGSTAPTALKELLTCADVVSDTVSITPDQAKVAS